MNDFVNPQHRGVTLPAGYKDMMEVLMAKSRKEGGTVRRPIIERFPSAGLLRVERFLNRFLTSKSETSVLYFITADDLIAFGLFRSNGVIKAEFCFPGSNTAQEEAVNEIFSEAGVVAIPNLRVPGNDRVIRTYPLPAELTEVLEPVMIVLRRAYEISGKDGLGFIYHENERLA